MSDDSDDEVFPSATGAPRRDYEIGYGKPPVQHRFTKGRSGNPLGRPRKARSFERADRFSAAERAKNLLLEEAYRPVLAREGEQTIELPAIQAVFRAMGVSAIKGDRVSQRTYTQLVKEVEAEGVRARLDHLRASIDYKCTWEERIEEALRSGLPEPQPIPHPDDIFIDFQNGEAHVCGPLTKESKAEWDQALQHRHDLQAQVSRYAGSYRSSRSAKQKAEYLAGWKLHQKFYDRLNDNLPKRYRRVLKDRCWEGGASLPGKQIRQRWPGDPS